MVCWLLGLLCLFLITNQAKASSEFSHVISLEPGWNLVSTPRLLASHAFSASSTSVNYDIYVMNPSSASKWSTMAEINQTEFQPLFGYFINNKVGTTTTLTFNYQENVAPNDRFFSRNLLAGWNAIGVANPGYALKQKDPYDIDTNNVKSILNSLSSSVQSVYDLTANQSTKYSTKVSDEWANAIYADANSLNDFRDTKAYVVYNTSDGVYNGYQNNDPIITTNSSLVIGLSTSTPSAVSVSKDSDRVPMAKINLTATDDGAVTVNSITVNRIGLSAYNQIDKVWAEKDGVIVASKKPMNSNDESVLTFSPALVINAGQTISLDLITSLINASGNIGLSIVAASAIDVTGAFVSGAFPINSNLMSPIYGDVNLALTNPYVSTISVKVGDEKVELGKFTVEFNTLVGATPSTAKDTSLKSIMFKNNGVEDLSTATMNLYLEQAGNKVSVNTAHTVVDGRHVTFYFPSTGLDLLKDDISKTFYIKGDVIAKENTGIGSFTLVLNKSTDLVVYEKTSGFRANIYNSTSSDAVIADNYAISNVTINAGTIFVSKKSTSPSDTTIIKGSNNVMLLANVRADEAITADGLNLSYSTGTYASTTDQFENVRVYLNGVLLDSFDPTASTTAASISKVIGSTLTLLKGDNEVKVMAKAKTTATTGAIKFILGSGIFTNMNPEYVVSGNTVNDGSISGTATGAIFSVSTALQTAPTVALLTLPSTLLTAGESVVSKFTVTADSNADVNLRKIVLTVATSSGTTLAGIGSNAIRVNGSFKNFASSLSGNLLTVDFASTPEVISAGATKTFEILASLTPGSGSQSVTTKIVEDGSYGETGSFEWSNASIETPTWSNGYRVPGLTTMTQVLSK